METFIANQFWICTDCDKGIQIKVEIYDDGTLYEESAASPEDAEIEEQFRLDHIGHKIEETDYLA